MKQRESKLDLHAATLADMEVQKKTLDDMLAWLREEGITCSASTLSRFLESQRQSRLQDKLLAQIASGARQCQDVEKQFGSNPAPELDTLIKLHRVLILQLSTKGNADPEFLKLADQLMRTAMEFVSAQTKAKAKEIELGQAERKLQLTERKAAAYDRAQAALTEAKSSKGGITKETLARIESELKLL